MPTREKLVLHIVGSAGIENSAITRVVRDLARHGEPRYRVEALFLSGHGPQVTELESSGITVHLLSWLHGAQDPLGALKYGALTMRHRPDVVHAHFGGRSVRWLARLSGARVIFHVHSHVAEFRNLERIRIPAGGADLVVADCRALADAVVGASPRVVYLGVPVPDLSPDPTPSSEFTVGCLGRLAPVKGTLDLIRAVQLISSRTPNLRVEIAGTGPDEVSLRGEVRMRGLEETIRFLGWVAEPAHVVRRWSVMAQPSIDDGFPLSVLEAMSVGVPVIGSAVGGIPEMITDERTGWLVPPGDPETLAQALLSAYNDPARVRKVGMSARESVKERFSVERMARDVESIYDELLTPQRR